MIGNLSGLKAVVFLWGRYITYSDRWFVMREQFVGRDRHESPAFLLFMRGNVRWLIRDTSIFSSQLTNLRSQLTKVYKFTNSFYRFKLIYSSLALDVGTLKETNGCSQWFLSQEAY